jgi:hypothetical protein
MTHALASYTPSPSLLQLFVGHAAPAETNARFSRASGPDRGMRKPSDAAISIDACVDQILSGIVKHQNTTSPAIKGALNHDLIMHSDEPFEFECNGKTYAIGYSLTKKLLRAIASKHQLESDAAAVSFLESNGVIFSLDEINSRNLAVSSDTSTDSSSSNNLIVIDITALIEKFSAAVGIKPSDIGALITDGDVLITEAKTTLGTVEIFLQQCTQNYPVTQEPKNSTTLAEESAQTLAKLHALLNKLENLISLLSNTNIKGAKKIFEYIKDIVADFFDTLPEDIQGIIKKIFNAVSDTRNWGTSWLFGYLALGLLFYASVVKQYPSLLIEIVTKLVTHSPELFGQYIHTLAMTFNSSPKTQQDDAKILARIQVLEQSKIPKAYAELRKAAFATMRDLTYQHYHFSNPKRLYQAANNSWKAVYNRNEPARIVLDRVKIGNNTETGLFAVLKKSLAYCIEQLPATVEDDHILESATATIAQAFGISPEHRDDVEAQAAPIVIPANIKSLLQTPAIPKLPCTQINAFVKYFLEYSNFADNEKIFVSENTVRALETIVRLEKELAELQAKAAKNALEGISGLTYAGLKGLFDGASELTEMFDRYKATPAGQAFIQQFLDPNDRSTTAANITLGKFVYRFALNLTEVLGRNTGEGCGDAAMSTIGNSITDTLVNLISYRAAIDKGLKSVLLKYPTLALEQTHSIIKSAQNKIPGARNLAAGAAGFATASAVGTAAAFNNFQLILGTFTALYALYRTYSTNSTTAANTRLHTKPPVEEDEVPPLVGQGDEEEKADDNEPSLIDNILKDFWLTIGALVIAVGHKDKIERVDHEFHTEVRQALGLPAPVAPGAD